MSNPTVEAAARLMRAASERVPCAPVRDLIAHDDIETAYVVQSLTAEAREHAGARVVGCTVGLTSQPAQEHFRVSEPDIGLVFDDTLYAHGVELPLRSYLQPRIETEIAFVLGADLDRPRISVADLIGATAFVLPAIEIVDSRIAGWDITLVDTIADNASGGGVVLGTVPRSLERFDLARVGMTLERDGEEISHGSGAGCMGSPVVAAARAARELATRGRPLRAGDIVMSGALGPAAQIGGPSTFTARLDQLGEVEVNFTDERNP